MNKAIITGRITKDLELKKTQTNKSVLNFSLAVNKETKDANGNRQVMYINCQAWSQTADFLSSYAGKGVLIGVVGRIESSSYTDKQGNNAYETHVTVERCEILSKPKAETKEPVQTTARTQNEISDDSEEFETDDLPFY